MPSSSSSSWYSFFIINYFLIILCFIHLCQSASENKINQVISRNCSIYNNTHKYGGRICGSDGKTYANRQYLSCINNITKADVATAHTGPCIFDEKYCYRNLIYEPVCDTNGRLWSNVDSLKCHIRMHNSTVEKVKIKRKCLIDMNVCNITEGFDGYGYNPVCGNTAYTYHNVAQVKCLKKNGSNLKIVHDGACRTSHVQRQYGDDKAKICRLAHTKFEWNPVCASNGKTYDNPYILICNRPELGIMFNGPCNSEAHRACVRAGIDFNKPNFTTENINDRQMTENAVCANDGNTYPSIYHILCWASRNKYLAMKHKGPCYDPDDNPCGAIPCETSRFPICASNNITYISIEAMWCASRRSQTKISYKYDGSC